MKRTFLLVTMTILAGVFVLDGCKKFSRTTRISGEWVVVKRTEDGDIRVIVKTGDCVKTSDTIISGLFDGAREIKTSTAKFSEKDCNVPPDKDTSYQTVTKDTATLTIEVTINKDGTYTWSELSESLITGDISEIVTNGTWNFSGGVGDAKKKEQLLLMPSKVETKFTDFTTSQTTVNTEIFEGKDAEIYFIAQLKSDELILSWVQNTESLSGNFHSRFTYEATLSPK